MHKTIHEIKQVYADLVLLPTGSTQSNWKEKRERKKTHIRNATTLVIFSYIFYQKVSVDPNTENMCESPHRLQAETVDTPSPMRLP